MPLSSAASPCRPHNAVGQWPHAPEGGREGGREEWRVGGKITLHTQEQDLALYIAPVGKGPTPDSYIFYTPPIKSIFQCKCTSLLQLCTTHTHTHTRYISGHGCHL